MKIVRKCVLASLISMLMVSLSFGQASITMGRGQNKQVTTLHDLKVESELYGSLLVQRYEFSFFNDRHFWAEGELNCYLPEGSRVVEYAMSVQGKKRDGVVVSANIAVDAYEDIVRQRTDPGLLEIDEKNNKFRMRVFPVEANKEKRVWITTVRLVNKDSVDLGLEHLGVAKTVSGSITVIAKKMPELKSPEGWKFEKIQGGWKAVMRAEDRALPACELGVNVKKRVFKHYDSESKTTYYASIMPEKKQKLKAHDGVTQLWWDGTTEPSFEVLNALSNWMKWKQTGEVELTVFRDELHKLGKFTIEDGKCDALLQKLHTTQPFGIARPSLLDWKAKHAGVVIVSDGVFAEGYVGVPEYIDFPLHVIGAQGAYLQGLSYLGQNLLLPEDLHDLCGSSYQAHNVQTGFSVGKASLSAVENKAAYWLWAMNTAKLYRARGYTNDAIKKFHTKHSVADGNFSWIVLESLRQHIRYDIPPAESEVKMLAAWNAQKGKAEGLVWSKIRNLEGIWKKRCNSHLREAPTFKQNAQRYLKSNAEMMLSIPKEVLRLKLKQRRFYEQSKTLVDDLNSEADIYDALEKFKEEHGKIAKEVKVMHVAVSGQVGSSGPILLPMGSTLNDAITKAMPTTFAALNRVELLRNGKVYKYSMRNKEHQKVRVYPHDQINVPQQRFFGNGGAKPGERVPFKKYREKGDPMRASVSSKRAKLVWDSDKPYLKALNKDNKLEKQDWYTRYFQLRLKFGWKADFYEDLICLLEEEKRRDMAELVACDLAELEPNNAEVLRRAARSLHRLGRLDLAQSLYQRLVTLSPDSDIGHYDLGRIYESKKDYAMAASHFWKACLLIPAKNAEGRAIVYLEDLNANMHRGNLSARQVGVPSSLVQHIAMDTRVVLRWDAEQCNADLIVVQPLLGIGTGFIYPVESVNKWKWSRNVSRGMGPESCAVRNIDPGEYYIKAKFKGDWVHTSKSTVTMTVEVIRNFGSEAETRETVTRRIPEGKTVDMMLLERAPAPKLK